MTWAQPGWFWAIPVVVALLLLGSWAARRAHARLARVFGPGLLDRVLPPAVRRRRVMRDLLWTAGLLACVVALAEPRFGKALRQIEGEGVDLVLVVDLSRSMDATDVDPSRLERARREVLDLVDLMENDRIGLVTFAGGAWPRLPLTLDRGVLRQVVRELDTRTFQAQGSAVDEALRQAAKLLQGQRNDAGQAVLVLSDGEVHDVEAAHAAADALAEAGIPVFGLVIGSAEAPIPNGDGTNLVDPSTGAPATTTPTVEVLAELARRTGGAVARSVPGSEDTTALYRDEIRPALRAAVQRQARRETWRSAFQTPLAVGVLALLLGAWLGDGRRRPSGLAALALLLALPVAAQAATVREGDVAYREGRYQDAVRVFTELSLEDPDDPDVLERLAAARYRAGDAVGAARAYARQAELTDDPDARFHEGNAWWRAGHLDRALDRYEEVLARDPSHPGATQNRTLLQQELAQRRAQAPPPPPKQGPGEGGSGEPGEAGDGQQAGQGEPPPPTEEGQQDDPSSGGQDAPSGEPQDGRQGNPEGSPEEGASPQGASGSQGTPDDGGTRREEGQSDAAQGALGEASEGQPGEEPGAQAAGPVGEPRPGQGMTAEQADRVLEGVEEGKPRVYIPGERSEKPW